MHVPHRPIARPRRALGAGGTRVAAAARACYIRPAVALLDALRSLTSFGPGSPGRAGPPPELPECDLALLADVLEAHGLAPLASYQVEATRLGARLPQVFREKLLGQYQAVANDNVLRIVSLRGWLRAAPEVPVVLLDAAAYLDWLYPHMAFRPVGELRVALRREDRPAFAAATEGLLALEREEHGGGTAVFTDGRLTLVAQDGLWPGAPAEPALFERATPFKAFGPRAGRPAKEEALLATVAEQGRMGLLAPLLTFVDLRELLRLGPDAAYVKARAQALGLARALRGASLLVAGFFPEVADAAAAVRPELGAAERLAVDRVVEAARDPARLRHLRGVEEAVRLVVSP